MPESHEASTKTDVETRLHGASEAIQQHVEAIQEEVVSTGPVIRDFLRRHPLTSVGGSLLAGLLVGWLLSGGRKSRLRRSHRRLLQQYVDALRDEVRATVAEGAEVGEAVQDALRHRAPLIVYSEDGEDTRGLVRKTFDMAAGAAFPLLVRSMLTGFLERTGPDGLPEEGGDVPGEGISVGGEPAAS